MGVTFIEADVPVQHVRLKGSCRNGLGVVDWFSGCSCGWVDGVPRGASQAGNVWAGHRDGKPEQGGDLVPGLHVRLIGYGERLHHGRKARVFWVACCCGWNYGHPGTASRCDRAYDAHVAGC